MGEGSVFYPPAVFDSNFGNQKLWEVTGFQECGGGYNF